jgi:hypothetical protein
MRCAGGPGQRRLCGLTDGTLGEFGEGERTLVSDGEGVKGAMVSWRKGSYGSRMCRACAVHVPCMCSACAVHVPCMCRACAVHVPCMCVLMVCRAVHTPCAGYAAYRCSPTGDICGSPPKVRKAAESNRLASALLYLASPMPGGGPIPLAHPSLCPPAPLVVLSW